MTRGTRGHEAPSKGPKALHLGGNLADRSLEEVENHFGHQR
ncbi:MAG: hypothetical protein ACRDV4_09235 [Acidimicrobiales bacterium]